MSWNPRVYVALPEVAVPVRTVADVLVETLVASGVRHVFGMVGTPTSRFAYGKLTGRPAVAGPGSTNLLTGLYDAKLDQAPVITISGQVLSKVLGRRGAFHDLNLSAEFKRAISSVTLQAGSDHSDLASLTAKHTVDGRGVAHLVLPDEVQILPPDRADACGRR